MRIDRDVLESIRMVLVGIVIGISLTLMLVRFCNAATIPRYEKVGDFVCNIMLDGKPVKEITDEPECYVNTPKDNPDIEFQIRCPSERYAVIPFNSEYKLLLKNNNDRKAAAKITIDGAPISSFGDLVIGANSEVTLERFITESLTEGKRFKFVPLNHPEVDDPSREENGVIRVEFRLQEKQEYIIWEDGWYLDVGRLTDNSLSGSDIDFLDTCTNCSTTSSSAEPGATIAGSDSSQKFRKVDIEFEDKTWTVEIRLKGVRK